MRIKYLLIIVLCFLFSCNESLITLGFKDDSEPKGHSNIEGRPVSLEEWLAIDDAEANFQIEETNVVEIGTLLKNLSEKYYEPVDSIAKTTFLIKAGINFCNPAVRETNLALLQKMKDLPRLNKTKYNEALNQLMNHIHARD